MSWSTLFSLTLAIGEIPLHANILIISMSSPYPSNISKFANYYHKNQITLLNCHNYLNRDYKKSINPQFDLVVISGNMNPTESIFQVLEKLRNENIAKEIWVDWFTISTEKFIKTIENWPGIHGYELNQKLYFNLLGNSTGPVSTVYEVYCIRGKKIISNLAGSGRVSTITRRRKNFKQMLITGTHVRNWNMKTKTGRETAKWNIETYTPTYQYLAYAQDLLNFSLQTLTSDTFTKLGTDGKWIGMIEHVLNGKADLAVSADAILVRTAQEVRYLSPTTTIEVTKIYYSKEESKSHWMYIHAFRKNVWQCIWATLFLIMVSGFIIKIKGENTVWFIVGLVTHNDWTPTEIPTPFRCLALTVSMLTVVLFAIFSGRLISTLSTARDLVDTVEDLIDEGYSFGFQKGSYLTSFGQLNNPDIYKKPQSRTSKVYANVNKQKPHLALQDGAVELGKTVNAKYAFITQEVKAFYTAMSQVHTDEEWCEGIRNIPVSEYSIQFSSFVRKDSPFSEHFNFARILMKQSGIAELGARKKIAELKRIKPDCKAVYLHSFSIYDLTIPFQIVAFGIPVALVVLVLEIIVKMRVKMKLKRPNSKKVVILVSVKIVQSKSKPSSECIK